MRDKQRLVSLISCSHQASLPSEQTDNWMKSFCAFFFTSVRNAYRRHTRTQKTFQQFINDDRRAMSKSKWENITISLPLIDGKDHGQNVLNNIEFTSILSLIHTKLKRKNNNSNKKAVNLFSAQRGIHVFIIHPCDSFAVICTSNAHFQRPLPLLCSTNNNDEQKKKDG